MCLTNPYACATGVNMTCPVNLTNTGELTLTNVLATTAAPITTDCGTTATLAPGASTQCTLTATAVQDDYDAGTLVLSVASTAGHLGFASRTLGGTLSYSSSISLNHSASMDLVATASGSVSKAADTVSYTITATNTGAVRIRDLALAVPAWLSLDSCTPALPGPWIVEPFKQVVCQASYSFSQDFYEAGPLSMVASATTTSLPDVVHSAPAVVTPTYTSGVDVQIGTCSLPSSARK